MPLNNPSSAVAGYTEKDGNDTKLTSAVAGWEDWDLSSLVPLGVKAVDVQLATGGGHVGGARQNGSSATMRLIAASYQIITAYPDANRVIEVYNDGFATTYRLLGYWV